LSWHKAAHANLLNDAYDLKAQVRSGQKTLGDLREFIVNEIITQHMLSADKAFFPLFQSKSSTLTKKSATSCDI
jgi:hemerythrin